MWAAPPWSNVIYPTAPQCSNVSYPTIPPWNNVSSPTTSVILNISLNRFKCRCQVARLKWARDYCCQILFLLQLNNNLYTSYSNTFPVQWSNLNTTNVFTLLTSITGRKQAVIQIIFNIPFIWLKQIGYYSY